MEAKEALVIIDMLNDFILEGAPLEVPGVRSIVPRIRERLHRARELGQPVIFICDSHTEDDPEFRVWPRHAVQGTSGAQVVEELKPLEGERIVRKRRFSGFFETDLDRTLRELGVTSLVLTGVVTNICVLYTTADAAMRGYRVVIPRDCVFALTPEEHRFALQQMEKVLGAEVV